MKKEPSHEKSAVAFAVFGFGVGRLDYGLCKGRFLCNRGLEKNYAPVPKTGQTTSYGTRDDGALHKGVVSPAPRFTDNGNGTVTDNLTKLIWMKNAHAFDNRTFTQALSDANGLAAPAAGLSDGSKAGDWRLPNVKELQSLFDYGRSYPALPAGHPFTNVQSAFYWSSTTFTYSTVYGWYVDFTDGSVYNNAKTIGCSVWCVRGGS